MVKVLENRVLKKISGSMRKEVRGDEGNCIRGLCGYQIRNEEMDGDCGEKQKCMQGFGGQT